jgi:hypothetical protein
MSRKLDTRSAVGAALASGASQADVARLLGVSRSTVAYHAARLGLPSNPRCARRYDWAEIQRYYEAGHSIAECQERFGFAKQAWNNAMRRGDVVARPRAGPIESLRGRWNLKRRLIEAGLKANACEGCGIAEWRGRPLTLALHHRNGVGDDNRLENLALLCPNCHSQTDNFAGRNVRRLRSA